MLHYRQGEGGVSMVWGSFGLFYGQAGKRRGGGGGGGGGGAGADRRNASS